MADAKAPYSTASNHYTTKTVPTSTINQERFNRSKERELKYNDNWNKQKVNINEVVNKFTPNCIGKVHGIKFDFENDKYIVRADMASGYLRIYDKNLKSYIEIDGSPSNNRNKTHYKIKRREEM